MFLARTLTGQKTGCAQAGQFRTFDPVDMQGLIHSRSIYGLQNGACQAGGEAWPAVLQCRWRDRGRCTNVRCRQGRSRSIFFLASKVEARSAAQSAFWPKPAFFFANTVSARQVYKQTHVYRMVVVVNDPHTLWINPVLLTRSNVYAPHKAVGHPCMCLVEKLDKIRPPSKKRASSQSVPVDMQTLIHNG